MIETLVKGHDLFESLGREEEQEVRKLRINSKGFHSIVEVFEKHYVSGELNDIYDRCLSDEAFNDAVYKLFQKAIPKHYSQKDIQHFIDYQAKITYEQD